MLASEPAILNEALLPLLTGPRSVSDLLTRSADLMLTLGFDRVRFYQAADDHLAKDQERRLRVYLTFLHYSNDSGFASQHDAFDDLVGLPIDWRDTTLGRLTGPNRFPREPMVESCFAKAHCPDHSWIDSLGLRGRSWIDIPVNSGSANIGLLAADWRGPPEDVTHSLRQTLAAIGELLGSLLASTSPPVGSQVQDRFSALYDAADSVDDFAIDATRVLQEELRIATAAVFRYSWTEMELRRIWFASTAHADEELSDDDDSYSLLTPSLTARAWYEPRFRTVVDFRTICEDYPELVAPKSHAFHEALGPLTTIAYGVIGDREPQYVIRLVNSVERPRLPFLNEFEVLRRAFGELGPLIDSLISQRRTTLARSISRRLGDQDAEHAVIAAAHEGLREEEGLHDIAVVSRRGDSELRCVFPRPDQAKRDAWLQLVQEHGLDLIPRFLTSLTKRGTVLDSAAIFGWTSVEAIIVVPFAAGGTEGAILVPSHLPSSAAASVSPSTFSRGTKELLQQLAIHVGAAIETNYIREQTVGATQALSLVGHELKMPIATMASRAEQGLWRAKSELLHSAPDAWIPQSIIEDALSQLAISRDDVHAATELGRLVAAADQRTIIGQRRPVDVRTLLNSCIFRVRQEIQRGYTYAPHGLRWEPPVVVDVDTLVCHRSMLSVALTNLLRNASKYSVEQATPTPITVRVTAHRGKAGAEALHFDIGNVGVEIPTEARDSLFEPFVRGPLVAPTMARRGMGLGLYLAREIARSHGGDVEIVRNDPLERGRPSGDVDSGVAFETEIRLRIAAHLPVGQYEYVANPKEQSR